MLLNSCAERGELVVALDRDRRGEVPAAEPSRRLKEAAQLSLETARSEHREREREHQKSAMKAAARTRLPVTDAVVEARLDSTVTLTGAAPKPRKLCVTAR